MTTRYKWIASACVGFTVAFVSLWGCRKEPTTWSVDVHLPVMDVLVDWADVLPADASLELEPDEVAHLIWRGPLATLDVSDLAQIPDTTVTNELTPDFIGGPIPVPPGNTLLDQAEDIAFNVDGAEFRALTLDSGFLAWSVESTTDGYVELRYDFPGVIKDGEPVVLEIVLPPATTVGGLASAAGVLDIAGATVDFTGVSGSERNRIASNLVIGTPEDITDTAQVFGDDSIRVAMTFTGMQVRDIEGYFGNFEVELNENVSVFDPGTFPAGLLGLSPQRADLKLINGMGADLRLNLGTLALSGNDMSHPDLDVDQFIARADWSAGAPPTTDTWSMNLLETSPPFFDLFAQLPEDLTAMGTLELNPLGDVSGGNDYFHKDFAPSLNLDLDLPLRVALTDLLFRDTLRISATEVPDFDGVIALSIRNGFPVAMQLNGSWEPAGTPFEMTLAPGSGAHAPVSEVSIPVTSAELAAGGEIWFSAGLATQGYTAFTGMERIRIQARIRGTHNIVIE